MAQVAVVVDRHTAAIELHLLTRRIEGLKGFFATGEAVVEGEGHDRRGECGDGRSGIAPNTPVIMCDHAMDWQTDRFWVSP